MFKIFKLFFIPAITIILCISFFMLFLSPQHRKSLLTKVLTSLPLVNNFVEKTYDTNVYGLEFTEANDLKTATWAVDFPVIIENRKGEKYYAIQSYMVEAGFDLSKAVISQTDGKYLITMPPVKVINCDLDEKKNITIIRNDLQDDYDNFLQPVKMAYKEKAFDLALESNMLDKAEEKAKSFLQAFLKDAYGDIDIKFIPQDNELEVFESEKLPFCFKVGNSAKNLQFIDSQSLGSTACSFKDSDKDNYFPITYMYDFKESFKELKNWFKTCHEFEECQMFVSYYDPFNPSDQNWVGGIKKDGSFVSILQEHGKLYSLWNSAIDKKSSRNSKKTAIYLMASIQDKDSINSLEVDKYVNFVQTKNKAIRSFFNNTFNNFKKHSYDLLELCPESYEGKLLSTTASALVDGLYYDTGEPNVNSLLRPWISAHHGNNKYFDLNARKYIRTYIEGNPEVEGLFYSYILTNFNRLNLEEDEKSDAIKYFTENAVISKSTLLDLEKKETKSLFKRWISKKVDELKNRHPKKYKNKGLFSDSNYMNGEEYIHWNEASEYPFYDSHALEYLHNKGKMTTYNKLSRLGLDLDLENHTIVVLTAENNIFRSDKYDVFILMNDQFLVVRNFLGDVKENDIIRAKYSDINSGLNEFSIGGEQGINHKNPTMVYMFGELARIYRSSREDSGAKLEEYLLGQIKSQLWSNTYTGPDGSL